MNYFVRMTILLIISIFCSHYEKTAAQIHDNSPWASTRTAESFLEFFMSAISRSVSFTNQQIDDMSAIADSILSTMEIMARSGKSSSSILQALNVAFASSVADIAVTEVGGSSINEKTNAITDALAQAFLQTTGSVNSQFIEEIRRLVNMFAEASANNVLSTEEPKSSVANLSGVDALLQGTKVETGSEAASEERDHLESYYGLKEIESSRDESRTLSTAQSFDGSKQVASRDSSIESHYRHDNKMSGEQVPSSYKPEAAEKSGSESSRQDAAYPNPETEASSAYTDASGSSFGSQTSGVKSQRSEFKTEKVGARVPSLSAVLNLLQPDYGTSGGDYPFPETRPYDSVSAISTAPSGSAEPYYETSKKLPNFLDQGSLFQETRIYNSGTADNSAVISSTNTPERPDNGKNTKPQKLKYYQQKPDSFRLEIEGTSAAANTTRSSTEHKYETKEPGSRPQESESYSQARNKANNAVAATRPEQDNIVAEYNTPESDFRTQGSDFYFPERGSWPQDQNIYAPEVASRILKTGTAANKPIEPNNESLEKNTKPQKMVFLQERPRLFDEEATANIESVARVVGNPKASEYAPMNIRYRSRGPESYDQASTSTVSTAAENVARLDTDYDFLKKVYEKLSPVQEKPLYKPVATTSSASAISGKSNLSGPHYKFSEKDNPLPVPDVTKQEPELYGQGIQNMEHLPESTYGLNKQRAEQKESTSYSPRLRDQGISISERSRRIPELSASQKYVPRPKMNVIIDASSTRSSAKGPSSEELRYQSQRPKSYDLLTGATNAASTVEVNVPIGSSEKHALPEKPEIRYERPQTYNPRANYSRYMNTADTAAAIGDLLRTKYISKKTEIQPLGFESYGSSDAANTLEGSYAVGSLLKPIYRTPSENYEILRKSIDRPKYAARGAAGAKLTPDNQFQERDVVYAEARDQNQRPMIYESQATKDVAVADTSEDGTIKPYYAPNMPRETLRPKKPTYGQTNSDGVTATVAAVSGSVESNFRSQGRDVVPHELKTWQPRSEINGAEETGRDSFKARVASSSIRNGLKQLAAGLIKPMSDGSEEIDLTSYFSLDSDDKPLERDNRPEKPVIYGHKAIGSATGIATIGSGSDYNYDEHAINAQSLEQYSSRQAANVGSTIGASLKLDYGYPGIDYQSKLPKIDGPGSVNLMTPVPSEADSYLLSNFQPSQRYASSQRRRTYTPEATSSTKISTTATSEDAQSNFYHVPENPRLRYSGSKTIYEPKQYLPQDSGLYDISTANSAAAAEHNLTNFTGITEFGASEPKARAQEPSVDRPEVLTSSAETAYIKTRPTIYSYSPRRGEAEFQIPKRMSHNSETKTDNKATTEAGDYPSGPIYGRTRAKPRPQWTEYGPHEPGNWPPKSVLGHDRLESYETESDREAGTDMESGRQKPHSSRAAPVDRESAEESSDGAARNLKENVKVNGLGFETDSDDINLTSKSGQQLSSSKSFLNSLSGFKSSYLYDVINDLFNSALTSNPGLSDCEILVQVLLDVITAIEYNHQQQ